MQYFSMFSGIGGFEYGIEQAYNSLWDKGRGNVQRTERKHPKRGELYDKNIEPPTCIGYSEINKYAKAIYQYHYPEHQNYGNAKDIVPESIPDFDLLVGGFPCQAFSIAGKRGGFDDTRGTLFFDVARVLKAKQPDWFLLENVKGLCSHDAGKTMRTIYGVLTDLGYTVGWEVVNSCKFGVPQNRERIFFVGHLTEAGGRVGEVLSIGKDEKRHPKSNETGSQANTIAPTIDTRVGAQTHRSPYVVSGTWRTHKDGRGFRELENPDISPCIPARAREDGSGQPVIKAISAPDYLNKDQNGRRVKDNEEPSFTLTSRDKHGVQIGTQIRRLTPTECERLQGFPDGWTKYGLKETWKSVAGNTSNFLTDESEVIEISDTQRYKALGNAVTTNVIESFITKILEL